MKNKKRTICFPIMNRVHYARQKRLLSLLQKSPKIELQLVVGGSILLDKYGERFLPAIEKEGFFVGDALYNVIEGGNHVTMAKTAGLTALEFSNSLHKLNSDIVVIRGDRFEQLAIAMVAAYLNKTIAHIEGGDVSGTIDESVRHAITKLAHIHFVTNEAAHKRVIQMGENPASVFNVGSPDVEFAATVKKNVDPAAVNGVGTGHVIDVTKPYLMVMFHPVTTEKENRTHMETLLETVDGIGMQVIWFWPNSDAGTNEMAHAIRVYRERGKLKNNQIRFVTDLLPENFIALLRGTQCLVGNSSAGIKESSYLGIPVVNIGTRQHNRLKGPNVCDAGYEKKDISAAIETQLAHGPYPTSDLYFKKDTSKKIVEILSKVPLQAQKKFYEREA
ncbi:MAG: UDP-N-acetylglucosamine 2-epimerase [bacterium]|nr:UDP-N-acetylglucosamine 2-epimerase [bacterium]